MRIQTPKETRREMAQQISERLGIPARYSGAPSFAYVIGEIAVERDGSLVSGNTDLLESLKPLLARKGYIRQTAQASRMTVQEPVTGATVAVLTNLINMLFSYQCLIGKMAGTQMVTIPDALVEQLREEPPDDLEALGRLLEQYIEASALIGFDFKAGKACIDFPFERDKPERWNTYAVLAHQMVAAARSARRVAPRLRTPENEKYTARNWLLRLGMGGPDFKAQRHVLLQSLNGYAAFKSAADMQAHRSKYAALRRQRSVDKRAEGEQEERA